MAVERAHISGDCRRAIWSRALAVALLIEAAIAAPARRLSSTGEASAEVIDLHQTHHRREQTDYLAQARGLAETDAMRPSMASSALSSPPPQTPSPPKPPSPTPPSPTPQLHGHHPHRHKPHDHHPHHKTSPPILSANMSERGWSARLAQAHGFEHTELERRRGLVGYGGCDSAPCGCWDGRDDTRWNHCNHMKKCSAPRPLASGTSCKPQLLACLTDRIGSTCRPLDALTCGPTAPSPPRASLRSVCARALELRHAARAKRDPPRPARRTRCPTLDYHLPIHRHQLLRGRLRPRDHRHVRLETSQVSARVRSLSSLLAFLSFSTCHALMHCSIHAHTHTRTHAHAHAHAPALTDLLTDLRETSPPHVAQRASHLQPVHPAALAMAPTRGSSRSAVASFFSWAALLL